MRSSLLALALLLAGCAPAPKPTPMPLGNASQEAKITFEHTSTQPNPDDDWLRKEMERRKDPKYLAKVQKHWDSIHAAPDEIAVLKQRVAQLEKRLKMEPEYKLIDSCPEVERTDLGETIAPKGNPFKRIYYYGGAWCNVWADAKGLHWEACK